MIKNKVATLAKNLKNNKDVREQSLRLITELAGVATSVSTGNHSYKLQRLISRTTLGFSTAIALRTLIEIVREHSQDRQIFIDPDQYDVRIFSNDNLYNEIKAHIRKNYTTKVKVDGTKESEIIIQSLDVSDYYSDITDETATCAEELPDGVRSLVEGSEANKGVHVYIEPTTEVETFLDMGDFKIETIWVERQPMPPKDLGNVSGLKFLDPEPSTRGSRGYKGHALNIEKRFQNNDSYLFKCSSVEERLAVMDFLLSLGPKAHGVRDGDDAKVYRGSADIYVADATGGGSWSQIPARTADTVILPDGLLDEMVKEIKTFLQHEKLYYMLGVPYHHGIMLSGAPGTGKSSAAQAIASELRMQTYSVSLSTLESNDAFIKFIKNVSANSVVLIEDIDVASSSVSARSDKKGGVTMETLLNVLDGILSPHGCIFVLTTNHLDQMDPAVVRPGRIDATYDITYLVDEQFEKLCRKFMQLKPDMEMNLPSVEGLKITPAAIVGIVKKHIPDIANALPFIIEFVNEKREEANTIAALEASVA